MEVMGRVDNVASFSLPNRMGKKMNAETGGGKHAGKQIAINRKVRN